MRPIEQVRDRPPHFVHTARRWIWLDDLPTWYACEAPDLGWLRRWEFESLKIEYLVKAKTQFKSKSIANNVEIIVPVPPDVDSPVSKANVGNVKYVPDTNSMVWCIKQFAGRKEFLMRAQFGFPSIESEERQKYSRVPIQIKFEIPYFTVSGVQVRYLKIVEKSGY